MNIPYAVYLHNNCNILIDIIRPAKAEMVKKIDHFNDTAYQEEPYLIRK
jgi:hypothetical protein